MAKSSILPEMYVLISTQIDKSSQPSPKRIGLTIIAIKRLRCSLLALQKYFHPIVLHFCVDSSPFCAHRCLLKK